MGCGYTQLRTATPDHGNSKRAEPVKRQGDLKLSERISVLAKRLAQFGPDSLSHAQSDSIGRVIVYLTRKKTEYGLESFTGEEREFFSLIVKMVRNPWHGAPHVYEDCADSVFEDGQK
jgi:hypothetical protein